MAGFSGKTPVVVHLETLGGKPFCFPDTKATIFKVTRDPKKVTCPRCIEKMKREDLPVYVNIIKTPEPAPEPEQVKPEELYRWENATVILKGPEPEPVFEGIPGAHVVNPAHPNGAPMVNKDVLEAIELKLKGAPPEKKKRGRPRTDPDGKKAPTWVFHKTRFKRDKTMKTSEGCYPLDIDDETAKNLRGLPIESVCRLVFDIVQRDYRTPDPEGFTPRYPKNRKFVGMSPEDFFKEYEKHHAGIRRMILGNIYRSTYQNIKEREAFLSA